MLGAGISVSAGVALSVIPVADKPESLEGPSETEEGDGTGRLAMRCYVEDGSGRQAGQLTVS